LTKLKVFGIPMSLVKTKDRWYNIAYYLRLLPPWAKEMLGRAGLRPAQVKITEAFAEMQTTFNDAGLNRWQRRLSTASVLRGVSFGGVPRPAPRAPAVEATVKASIAKAEAIVAKWK